MAPSKIEDRSKVYRSDQLIEFVAMVHPELLSTIESISSEFLNDETGTKFDGINKYDSWARVRAQRKDLYDFSENHVLAGLAGLAGAWKLLSSHYNDELTPNLIKRDDDENTADSPIRAFSYYIDMGFYPPPEILLTIAGGFNLYFASGGKLSLENIFFGLEQKRVGNKSARISKSNIYRRFKSYEFRAHKHESLGGYTKQSMEDIASNFFSEEDSIGRPKYYAVDIDTFLRNYRRWKESERRNSDAERT